MATTHCTTHLTPTRILDAPLILTAGGMSTPAPLGAAILSLAEGKRPPLLTGLPGYRPTVVRLHWQDMTTPTLSRDDWEWLAAKLAPLKRLHVHCQAGHGRTGTTLAILATLWGAVPEGQCPVTWVRTMYCPQAVETKGQLDYVARITGRTVTAEPAMPAYTPPPTVGGTSAWTGQGRSSTRTERDLWADPYASRDYFQTGVDDPPAPRRRANDDSLGARRERFSRYLPDLTGPATEHPIPIPADKRPAGDPPKARFAVQYPKVDGATSEAPPETPKEGK